jgi:transposase
VTREADKITAVEMIAPFKELAARHPTATAISIVVDNATYNRAAAVREWIATTGGQVSLIYLPPYAPNLNLIGRLWWFFKKRTLWNIHYPTLADFRAAIRDFFKTLPNRKNEIETPITSRFHFVGVNQPRILTA